MKRMKLLIGGAVILVAGIAAFIFLGGVGSPDSTPVAEVRETTQAPVEGERQVAIVAEASSTPTPVPVKLAPDFSLERLDGTTFSLSDYRGEKPVILDFWASWCHNCQRDMPRLSKWYDQYSEQVEVVGINLAEKASVAQAYVDRADISFPIVLDPRGEVSQKYGVTYTNTHVLISTDGSVARVVPGDISEEDIKSLIN